MDPEISASSQAIGEEILAVRVPVNTPRVRHVGAPLEIGVTAGPGKSL
jgi:hypothetical protein